jgi:hypothetical protein
VRRAGRIALFGVIAAVGTATEGWWTIPVLAALWVRVLPSDRGAVATTVLGAAAGWLILLGALAVQGPVPTVDALCSAILGLPRWGFLLVTLLFPAALAGAAALLTRPVSSA